METVDMNVSKSRGARLRKCAVWLLALLQCLAVVSAMAVFTGAAEDAGGVANGQTKDFGFDDNILISVFYPPSEAYINDEQYKLMADAGIKHLMGAGNGVGGTANHKKMAELCEKYGISLTVADTYVTGDILHLKEEEIIKRAQDYLGYGSTNGFYLLDEPYNPNIYIDAHIAFKKALPEGYMHLNFLPYASYPDLDTYKKQLNDWCGLCEEAGYPTEYLMYDLYPYMYSGGVNSEAMLTNLEAVREVGLKNHVKTGCYVQASGIKGNFRSPNRDELRHQLNLYLAFGMKQLSYFTWFTPNWPDSEPFYDCIITPDGKPNPLYEWVQDMNAQIDRIGKTLVKCDALAVYSGQASIPVLETVPDDFFMQFTKKCNYVVSYLRDRESGRNYCMLVNYNYLFAKSFSVQFDSAVNSLEMLSYDTGRLEPVEMGKDNTVSMSLEPGGAVIFALPEGFDFAKGKDPQPADGTDLALDVRVSCSSSVGEDDQYMANLTDGKTRASDGIWRSNGGKSAQITLDLGAVRGFDRVELYPVAGSLRYGRYVPADFTVMYSEDGVAWRSLAEVTGYSATENTVPVLEFEEIQARFIRILITKFNGGAAELSEIMVFRNAGDRELPTGLTVDETFRPVYSPRETVEETDTAVDTAADTEPDTDADTTEEQTTAAAEPDTEATAPEATEGDTDAADGGCKSSVGGLSLALMVAAGGSAFLVKKRKTKKQ